MGATRIGLILAAALLLSPFAISTATGAPPGSVDPTFDPGQGPLHVSPGQGEGVLIQPDNKIIVGGNFNALNLAKVGPIVRFNPDGSHDTTFDTSHLAPTEGASGTEETALVPRALQTNGQVLITPGIFNEGYGPRSLLRLNADGSLDPSFNPSFEYEYFPQVYQVLVLADGKMLVSGAFNRVNGIERPSLARLNPDGSVDQSFNPARSGSVRLQSTGKLIVSSGYRLHSDGSLDPTFIADIPPGYSGFRSMDSFLVQADDKIVYSQRLDFWGTDAIRRLNADGTRDLGFQEFQGQFISLQLLQSDGKIIAGVRLNPNGTRDETFRPEELGGSVAQQNDGKLVTAGRFDSLPYGVRRLFLDGSLDPSFAPDVGLTVISRVKIEHACLLPNGKIVIAGLFNYMDDLPRTRIAVLNHDGTPDAGFDAGDLLVLPFRDPHLAGLFAQSDGKIFVSFEARLVRLNPDGTEDGTFHYTPATAGPSVVTGERGEKLLINGPDGLVRVHRDGTRDFSFQPAVNGRVLFIEPDGKIMVTEGNRTATRLHPDGALDTVLSGVGGVPTFDFLHSLVRQPDGKYLVSRSDILSKRDMFFRLNHDGTPDSSFSSDVATVHFMVVDDAGITVAGNIAPKAPWPEGEYRYGVVRLNFDGSRDQTFRPAEFNAGASLSRLLLQPDGNLIVAGHFDRIGGVERNGIARLIGGAANQIANFSTRAHVASGDAAEIGGFIITGAAPKRVIIRALGPSLEASGVAVSETLANPVLTLRDGAGVVIAQNDDWRDNHEAEIAGTGLAPSHNRDAAIVATLQPGNFTAVIEDRTGGDGLALFEIYDLDRASDSTLANISTRAFVGRHDNVLIGGVIVQGGAAEAIVRALGPDLAEAGVPTPLQNPTLELRDAQGNLLIANDDWRTDQEQAIIATGLAPKHERDSAILATLPPAAYTAILRGSGNSTGIGLLEVYKLE